MSDWRKAASARVKEKSQGATIKVIEGENILRVLPDKKDLLPDGNLKNPTKGVQEPPYREFRIHRHVGPDDAMVGCGKDITGQGKCWMCDAVIPSLEASASPEKRKKAQTVGAAEQFVVNASRLDAETKQFSPPKPWWVSTGQGVPGKQGMSLAVRIFSKISSSRKDYVDPFKGYNIYIKRTGQGIQTRYPEVEGEESPTRIPLSVLAAVKDLDAVVPAYDGEDQKSAYYGKPRERDGDRSERSERPAARRREPEPEPEPEPEGEELPLEEEPLPPEGEGDEPPLEGDEPPLDGDEPPLEDEPALPDEAELPPEDQEFGEEPPAEPTDEIEDPEPEDPAPPPPPRRTTTPAPATKRAATPISSAKPAARPAAAPATKRAATPPAPARRTAPAPAKRR